MILDKLNALSRERVRAAKEKKSAKELLKELDNIELKPPKFKDAITSFDGVSVIAEIKKASPSKGLIRPDFDHMQIAEEYVNCNVQCLSVLTEPEYFKGDLQFIRDIKSKHDIPVLRKDFVVDEYQIYEAKLAGADAVLLIMASLTDEEYAQFYKTAADLKLDALVETHNREEIERAVKFGSIIGVNNRNLQTFEEDLTLCGRLLEYIPKENVKVAESAIRSHADFEYLQSLNFDAALIGEAFMRENDIVAAVNNLRYGK